MKVLALQKRGHVKERVAVVDEPRADWRLAEEGAIAPEWIETVAQITGLPCPDQGARLLWARGIRSAEALRGFCLPSAYTPASPFEFGEEMDWAVARLVKARDRDEKIAIWGDFDADGITSTAVLWDGLQQFFDVDLERLTYFIPNRLKESHGLSIVGLDQLAAQNVTLIVTCDTGSTNPAEIAYAQSLGIEVIVSDHHTLPDARPDVVAIVNPRALPREHSMANLSGVAVAYKLVEALYETLPEVPSRPLSELVDLVAIGLIADLVELTGDCRYLAQIGIEQLQTHLKTAHPVRPGVAQLLKLCRRAGDRPTDISFGIGPRINAVSRIYGEASFCVELLTSKDRDRCQALAEKAELANARRKALQSDVLKQVTHQLETRDLSTTGVIVLCDPQWPVGVLGLVAGQVAQRYGRPTILLTQDMPDESNGDVLVRGSARSVNQIDLYDLVSSQAHLLSGFGGHPFAAGLSLPAKDLSMFQAAINQQYRQKMGAELSAPTVQVDLCVTVAELGQSLFQELKLLEPCGMGNPVPKLLIQNCWFENVWHQKLKDRMGGKVGYIKASFQLCDESGDDESGSNESSPDLSDSKFPGLWWGHYKEDLPPGRWDVVVELDYNSHPKSRRYEVRLIDIRPTTATAVSAEGAKRSEPSTRKGAAVSQDAWLIDRRSSAGSIRNGSANGAANAAVNSASIVDDIEESLQVDRCPTLWTDFQLWQHQAGQSRKPLALAYSSPVENNPIDTWTMLLGLAKFLSRTSQPVTRERLAAKLGVCDRTLELGLIALARAGFVVDISAIDVRLSFEEKPRSSHGEIHSETERRATLAQFLAAVQEEHFRRQYFYQAPVSALQSAILRQP
ncbi:single-stranded-DNA-specific exonuclease RecJ [cf. Phormidesmis sp. LEGE 11477]|uniref:single-stranded-DNA-specific exonuclease RecJ n=1 Tax=cf. Phormidesmis sp. LEGE 11477 TaxID=1828680 RepID=UPI00188046E5|nr:single-stranded-DNA-specific exonuclease RecJ [cf. Phormidesmis sp. LEGE 11477]MBE9062360.1 single-stranded-DNA-specific exonuclease RecJ [cf. Phormidesmis sp. LEGE 11477]